METAVTGWTWVLYADTPTGCDVIARGVRTYPDAPTARAAARALAGTAPARVLSVQDTDGCWRWRLYGDDGTEIAVSPDRFAQARASYLDITRLLCVLRRPPLRVGLRQARHTDAPRPDSDQAGTRRTGTGSA